MNDLELNDKIERLIFQTKAKQNGIMHAITPPDPVAALEELKKHIIGCPPSILPGYKWRFREYVNAEDMPEFTRWMNAHPGGIEEYT